MVLALVLLCTVLPAGVASQVLRTYLKLCKSLVVSTAFIDQSLSLLLLAIRQMCSLWTTNTKRCACDVVHAAEWLNESSLRFGGGGSLLVWSHFVEFVCGSRKEFPLRKYLSEDVGSRGTCYFSTVRTPKISLTVCVQPHRESWRMSLPCP